MAQNRQQLQVPLSCRARQDQERNDEVPEQQQPLISFQEPIHRSRKKMVSSGRLAYQISRYCENAM